MASASNVFVDTNVLLFAQDERVPDKRAAATRWLERCWRERLGRVSSQVLNELYANLRRVAPRLDVQHARAMVRIYRAWQPWPVDDATVDGAWSLQDRYSLSYWDALIVAAAQVQGCEILLSEDLQHDQQIDGVRVINPFLIGPDVLDASA